MKSQEIKHRILRLVTQNTVLFLTIQKSSSLLDKLEFVELINADSLFLHKPHTPNYRKGS